MLCQEIWGREGERVTRIFLRWCDKKKRKQIFYGKTKNKTKKFDMVLGGEREKKLTWCEEQGEKQGIWHVER